MTAEEFDALPPLDASAGGQAAQVMTAEEFEALPSISETEATQETPGMIARNIQFAKKVYKPLLRAPGEIAKAVSPILQYHAAATGGQLGAPYGGFVGAPAPETSSEERLGEWTKTPFRDAPLYRVGAALNEKIEELLPDDPRLAESFVNSKLPEAIGSTASFILAGMVGGPAAAAGLGSALSFNEMYEDAIVHGASEEQARKAAKFGIALGATEVLPISRIFSRFHKIAGPEATGVLRQYIVGVAEATGEEAAQELLQQVGGNVVAKQIYDKDRSWLEGAFDAGLTGGSAGLIISGLANAAGVHTRIRNRTQMKQNIHDMLLTPEGAALWATNSPELAEAANGLLEGKPSRGRFEKIDVGNTGLNLFDIFPSEQDRSKFVEQIRSFKESVSEISEEASKPSDVKIQERISEQAAGATMPPLTEMPVQEPSPKPTGAGPDIAAFEESTNEPVAKPAEQPGPVEAGREGAAPEQATQAETAETPAKPASTEEIDLYKQADVGAEVTYQGSKGPVKGRIVEITPDGDYVIRNRTPRTVTVPLDRLLEVTKPEAKQEAAPKQPWEMTFGEYRDQQNAGKPEYIQRNTKVLIANKSAHSDLVKQALSEGKPVPPEVLKDYPDLVKSASEVAAKEADKTKGAAAVGIMPAEIAKIAAQEKGKPVIPKQYLPDQPEAAERIQAAYGLPKATVGQKVIDAGLKAYHVATRAQEHIPNTGEFDVANELFRYYKTFRQNSSDQSIRDIAAILDPLKGDPDALALFSTKTMADDLLAQALETGDVRQGFKNVDEIRAYVEKLENQVAANPFVQKAIATRKAIVQELSNNLVNLGLLPPEAATRAETYYRRQVLDRVNLDRRFGAGYQQLKKGFQKGRTKEAGAKGQEWDYNTRYLEAEYEWMTDANLLIRQRQWLDKLNEQYGVKPLEDGSIPEGYAVWQAQPGNIFYKAFSIPEKLAESILLSDIESGSVNAKDIREVLAMGRAKEEMILPEPIVKQLESMKKTHHGALDRFIVDMTNALKAWTLHGPHRIIQFELRNMSGDTEAAVIATPKILKSAPKAERELREKYRNLSLSMSKEMKGAQEWGALDAGWATTEIPDINDQAFFRAFDEAMSTLSSIPGKIIRGYFERTGHFGKYREGVMRFAAYLHYLEQARRGKFDNYGASKPRAVDAVLKNLGPEAAAAKLSRELIGDYGNLTVMGNWLRNHLLWFWSWNEINMTRFPRLAANDFLKHAKAKAVGKTAVRTAIGATKIAAWTAIRLSALYAVTMAWNHLFFGDEEEQLSDYDKAQAHLILGRRADGSIRVFRRLGILGDLMEWFGINSAIRLYPKFAGDQISGKSMLSEMGKETLNKLVGGITPTFKAMFELPSGLSLFPEATAPRRKLRPEILAGYFGMEDLYKEVKGRLFDTGERGSAGAREKFLWGVSDPRRNMLSEIHELRRLFLEKKGKDVPEGFGISKVKAMRDAFFNADQTAFDEARQRYLADGGTAESFLASVKRIDPVSQYLGADAENEFYNTYLNDVQRTKADEAKRFAMEAMTTLVYWWDEAAGNTELRDTAAAQYANRLTKGKPKKPEDQIGWQQGRDEALKFLKQSGLSTEDITKAWTARYGKNMKHAGAMSNRMRIRSALK